MAAPRAFNAPGIDIAKMAQDLEAWLQPQGYETQTLQAPAGLTLQARQTQSWVQRQAVALTIQLMQQGDNLTVDIGTSKWALQAASGVAAAIVFWPLLAIPAYTAYKQKQIIDAAWTWVNQYIMSGGQTGAIAPVSPMPSEPAPTPAAATAKCPACGANVRAGAKFCDSCGAKLVLTCAKCGATLRADAKFCDACGEPVKQG